MKWNTDKYTRPKNELFNFKLRIGPNAVRTKISERQTNTGRFPESGIWSGPLINISIAYILFDSLLCSKSVYQRTFTVESKKVLIWPPVLRLEMKQAANHRPQFERGSDPEEKEDDWQSLIEKLQLRWSDSQKISCLYFRYLYFLSLQTVYKYSLVHLVQFIKRNSKS